MTPLPKEKPCFCLDASALIFSGCIRKLYWTVVDGWKPKENDLSMTYGNAFHRFRRIYKEKGMSALAEGVRAAQEYLEEKKCFVPPSKKHLNANTLAFICTQYAMKYPHGQGDFETVILNGEYQLERTFAIPYYSCNDFDILLTGTIDEIARHRRSGLYVIIDGKTTGSTKDTSYLKNFKLSLQFRFYRYVMRLFSKIHPEYEEMERKGIAWMVDAIFLRNTSEKDNMFQLSEVTLLKDEDIEETAALVKGVVYDKFIPSVYGQIPLLREGIITGTCHSFTNCTFFSACSQSDDVTCRAVLNQYYKQCHYNPLTFQT